MCYGFMMSHNITGLQKPKVEMFDKILVLSEYHKTLLPEYVGDDKVMISSNGVKQDQFVDADVKRDPFDASILHLTIEV